MKEKEAFQNRLPHSWWFFHLQWDQQSSHHVEQSWSRTTESSSLPWMEQPVIHG